MLSLKEFISKTKGQYIDVPWTHKSDVLKGQCVSLIQCYVKECLGQPAKARGNAKDWDETYVAEGLGKKVSKGQYGDILVFNTGAYGHIAIYIDEKTMYDQSATKKANYRSMQKNAVIIRPNATLIPDYTAGQYKLLKNKYIRLSPKVSTNKIKKKALMQSIADMCLADTSGYAKTKINSIWKFDKFEKDSKGNTWGRRKGINTDLWVCINDSTGDQAKKI